MNALLRQLDFKQLELLLSLHRTRNTYASATELNWSQPSVSRNLARLREMLEDPLFVRETGGLAPTPYMDRLATEIPGLLDALEQALGSARELDVEKWEEPVAMCLSNHAMHCWGVPLLERLQAGAPRVSWTLDGWHRDSAREIREGQYLAGIHFANSRWPKNLFTEDIARDSFKLMARAGHPLEGKNIKLEDLASFPITVPRVPDWVTAYDALEQAAAKAGVTFSTSLRTDNLQLAVANLIGTDSFMMGSKGLAAATPGLVHLPSPFGLSQREASVVLACALKDRQNPKLSWLREQVLAVTAIRREEASP